MKKDFFHVVFRPKGQFEMFRTPDWGTHAATMMYEELKHGGGVQHYRRPRNSVFHLLTGKTKRGGNWKVASVLVPIPTKYKDLKSIDDVEKQVLNDVVAVADYIQSRIEDER
jgi:hypothetical protein